MTSLYNETFRYHTYHNSQPVFKSEILSIKPLHFHNNHLHTQEVIAIAVLNETDSSLKGFVTFCSHKPNSEQQNCELHINIQFYYIRFYYYSHLFSVRVWFSLADSTVSYTVLSVPPTLTSPRKDEI